MNDIEKRKSIITVEYLEELRRECEGTKNIEAIDRIIKLIKVVESI